jgi:TonB-linked SusC/RagA family outer membrane protein
MKLRLFSKKVKMIFSLFVFFSFCMASVQAQKTVTGIVLSSEDNSPLPGASVVEKGTNNGTSTDFDGKFSLNVASDATTLVVSFIGYKTQEVTITDSELTITLVVDANALEEVVVVGYGTQKRSDIVASVASVDIEKAIAIPTTNVSEMLRGRAAGVQVNLADARPGGNSNILIRGKTSQLVGNEPLVIVDGLPFDDINDVVADDVTSIEILKDASATAIYGSRASNGVILITTKRGKEGKIAVNYHGYYTTQELTKNFDLYNPQEFAQLRREALRTTNPDGTFFDDDINFDEFELQALQNGNFVNWEDLVLRTQQTQNHSLSLSAGTENTKIYASASFFDQKGLIPTSGFERGSLRVNIDQKISEKLNVQANINFTTSTQDIESRRFGGTASLNFITLSPLAIPFDENGNLIRNPTGPSATLFNPLWNLRESKDQVKKTITDLNFVGNYKLLPNLSYRFNAFLRRSLGTENIYRSSLHSSGDDGINGLAILTDRTGQEYQIENQLDYTLDLKNESKLDFTLVQSVDEIKTTKNEIEKSNFPNDDLGFNGLASEVNSQDRDVTRRRLVSFMGRTRFNLFDKYLFTVTGRADGASVFAEGKKWAFFPAFAFAWKMQNESFLENSKNINELKLRLSYGETGNQGAPSTRTLGVADFLPFVFGDNTTSGGFLPLTRLPNPNLTWETTKTFNLGLDFGLFNNLFKGTIEYYNAKTEDLLLDRVLSGTSGFKVTTFNIGNVENRGFEFSLTSNIIRKENLNWSVTTTFSTNKNEITKLTGELDADGNPIDFPSQGLFVGESLDIIRQHQFDGIFQTQAEIDASAQADQTDIGPGNIRVVDQNGDGQIDDDDKIIIDKNPDWYGSISTNLAYKNFELFADLFIVEGATKVNPYLADFNLGGTLQGALNGIKVPYWTPENPSTTFPRPNADRQDPFLFALAVQDASYVRLRTLTLGYNIPKEAIGKIGLKNAKAYITATNLFTITDYKSYSPENNPGDFPDAKGFTFGVKLGF